MEDKLADEVDVRSLLAAAKVRLAEADLRKQRLQHELSQLQKRRRARTWSSSPLPLLNQPQNQRESPPQQQRERSVAMHSLESSAWSAPPSTPVTAASAAPPTTSRRARLRERHERYLERRRSRIAARQATRLAARAAARAKHGRSPRAPPRPASSTTTVPSTWAAVNMVVGGDDDVTSNLLLVAAREQQRALHLAAVRERRAIAALRRAAVPAPSAARAAIAPRRALRRAALFLDVRSIVAAGAACARWHVALSPVEAETGGSDDGRRCSVLWRQLARRGITAEERGAFWRLALFGQLGASESRGAAARPCHGSRTIFARSGVFNRLESCAAPLFELTATLAKLSHNTHEQNAAQISDRKVRLVAAELELLQRAATLEARVQQVYVTALRATSSGEGASTSSSPRDACRRFSLTHDTAANSSTADDDESRELAGARGGGSGNGNSDDDDDDDALAVAEVQRWIAPLSLIEVDLRRTYGCGKAWVGVALEQGESAATLADTWWEFGAGADPMLLVSSAAKYVSEVKAEAGTEEEAGDVVASARERQLRNVLCALILYFRRGDALAAMGYCQGMNFVAAMLLRHMGSADAFWAMVLMLRSERYGLRDIFSSGLKRVTLSFFILEELIALHLPLLHNHFTSNAISVHMFASGWFMTLFSSLNTLPLTSAARVWDLYITHGWCAVFRIVLALLRRVERGVGLGGPDNANTNNAESGGGGAVVFDFSATLEFLHRIPTRLVTPAETLVAEAFDPTFCPDVTPGLLRRIEAQFDEREG